MTGLFVCVLSEIYCVPAPPPFLSLRGGARDGASSGCGQSVQGTAASEEMMSGDTDPLPQRPRRAFGVKARAVSQPDACASASDAGVGTEDVVDGAAGSSACGEHKSRGIADGCEYDQAIQYVGEGGNRPLEEGEIRKYEYLDHTADVQFHSWGDTLEEAFEQMVVCMFSYITDLHTVETTGSNTVEVSGHDMESLLYNYMDEFLFQFCTEGFVARRVEIVSFDREAFTISARGYGEKFQVPGACIFDQCSLHIECMQLAMGCAR